MRSNVTILGILGFLVLLLTFPTWQWLWNEWWGNDYYSHGILILPLAAYMAWRQFQTLPRPLHVAPGNRWAAVLMGIGLVAIVFFTYNQTYYLTSFAMIALIVGLVWWFGGTLLLRKFLFPIGFLGLMIPLPFIEQATLPLALWTGVRSGAIAQWLGINVAITGAAVTLPNAALTIGAQCSGINSIISLTTLTTLLSYLLKGPLWGRLALVFSGILLAMLGNIFRVANLIFVARYWGVENAFTFYHDYSGFVYFTLTLLFLIPLARMFQCQTLRTELF